MSKAVVTRIVENVEVFTSSDNRPYAYIPCPANILALQAVPLRSAAFRNWFFGGHLSHVTYVPAPHAFRSVLDLLEARAFRDPDRSGFTVHGRVGHVYAADGPGVLLLDLANLSGDVVQITAGGWKLQPRCPVPLEPSPAALTIPMPTRSPEDSLAPLETLRSCLNLATDADWLRCLAWLLAALHPDGPHPVLILQGPPDSGKSFAARVLRAMVDPAAAPLAATPTTVRDVAGLARRHWVVALDHISRLSPNVADAIARLGSGLGVTFHEELRNRGAQPLEVTYRRPVILTVTDRFTCPENIASRALTVDCPAIPPGGHRTEAELRDTLNTAFPAILGALLMLLSAALRGAAQLTQPPAGTHCANALAWALCAAPAIGCTAEDLQAAFIPPPTIVTRLHALLAPTGSWTGTVTGLAAALSLHDPPQTISRLLKQIPGIEAEFRRTHNGRRLIHLVAPALMPAQSEPAPQFPREAAADPVFSSSEGLTSLAHATPSIAESIAPQPHAG